MTHPGGSFFEGTEKKVELVVGPDRPSLLELGDGGPVLDAKSLAGVDVLLLGAEVTPHELLAVQAWVRQGGALIASVPQPTTHEEALERQVARRPLA